MDARPDSPAPTRAARSASAGSAASATARGSGFRADVHGIRALAVTLVVIYHLHLGVPQGGFVGVDAFFVVSGFLITGHLVRELRRDGRVDLPAFWARRARRLIPSALVVIVVAGAVGLAVTPKEDWPRLGSELAASVLYVENWFLASASVDYLAAGASATPFQHFWSLGVEEQFYLVWPLLLLLAWRVLARRRRGTTRAADLDPTDSRAVERDAHRRLRVATLLVALVTAGSLAASIVLTATNPEPAYFWPHTRAWEFGAGALLALTGARLPSRLAVPAALLGWAALIAVGLLLPASVPYPGLAAALPVAATALIIAARAETGAVGRVLRTPPVRALGTLSYTLYLWHWPVGILLPKAVDGAIPAEPLVIAVVSLALAALTHVLVERPVLAPRMRRVRPRVVLAATAGAMVLVLAAPGAGWAAIAGQVADDRGLAGRLAVTQADCFGAAAIAHPEQCALNGDAALGFTPSTLTAEYDISPTWDECQARDDKPVSCVIGVRGGTRVALIGDSHAHHWESALARLAEERGWELHLFVKGGCEFSHIDWSDVDAAEKRRCDAWNQKVDAALADEDPYGLVFTSARADLRGQPVGLAGDAPDTDSGTTDAAALDPDTAAGRTAIADAGYLASWQPLIDRGTTVLGIRDTPAVGTGNRACLDANPDDVGTCEISADRAFAATDRLAAAAASTSGAHELDLTSSLCRDDSCPAVIGNVLVFRDSQHLTATYSATLAPALGRAVDAALESPAP
ncbi:acyltransferase family protein [Schumannella sp. 10F1B-5-1]|uniref:acyltransferase family protein n=1 Tax=Schumannella sp. 10F1B-5-1 TaxID=2590780 RepID=UPI0011302906|nr:acyltransferase family protein [Schumannella sp. 10F1B-5-1]TPW70133.1 acyltransferase [Schumannella sp. 10F1B-5-1]